MKYKKNKKDTLVGILAVIAVVSLLYAVNDNLTGQTIKERTTGFIEVRAELSNGVFDVYIDGEFIDTLNYNERLAPYKAEAGAYEVIVRTTNREDYKEIVNVVVGKTTIVRAWNNP